MKKLIVFAALGFGAFAVWRKVQSDRAELDLWTEATAADEDCPARSEPCPTVGESRSGARRQAGERYISGVAHLL